MAENRCQPVNICCRSTLHCCIFVVLFRWDKWTKLFFSIINFLAHLYSVIIRIPLSFYGLLSLSTCSHLTFYIWQIILEHFWCRSYIVHFFWAQFFFFAHILNCIKEKLERSNRGFFFLCKKKKTKKGRKEHRHKQRMIGKMRELRVSKKQKSKEEKIVIKIWKAKTRFFLDGRLCLTAEY